MFRFDKCEYLIEWVIRGLLKESVTKTSHEAGEETASETASESVALLPEPDLGGAFTHTLEQSFTVSQHMCVLREYKCVK